VPTPLSASGSRFDNEMIAKASEKAKDIFELEKLTGYSLDDGGAFRRRLANMVRNGQIDPKFKPTGVKRPVDKAKVAEAVAVKPKATKPAATKATEKKAA